VFTVHRPSVPVGSSHALRQMSVRHQAAVPATEPRALARLGVSKFRTASRDDTCKMRYLTPDLPPTTNEASQ